MKIQAHSNLLCISELRELNESRAQDLVQGIRSALAPGISTIEFDLTQLRSIDCGTVDVLLTVHEEVNVAGTTLAWRVMNPPPDVRQMFELVRLHHLFEIFPPRLPGLALL